MGGWHNYYDVPWDLQGIVYILHFHKPFHHAKHYVGWCKVGRFGERMSEHHRGIGAKLTAAVKEAGIGWEISWRKGSPLNERWIKNQKRTPCICPYCNKSNPKHFKKDTA